MNQLESLVNQLGGNLFILEFINTNSPIIRNLYLPSLLYTEESIQESNTFTNEDKINAMNLIDSMNSIIENIFDTPQINLIMVHTVNEAIERMAKIRSELTKGKLLSLLLDNNRDEPNILTRQYELNEITRFVYDESLKAFKENASHNENSSEYLMKAIENIFSYKLVNKICVDTIDLFDTYIFERL